jgi:hypothetical protein
MMKLVVVEPRSAYKPGNILICQVVIKKPSIVSTNGATRQGENLPRIVA